MESNSTLNKLKNIVNQLKQLHYGSPDLKEGKKSENIKKESCLLTKLVNCFHEILSDNLNIKNESNTKEEGNNCHYWDFICKHFNTPVIIFCQQYEKDETTEEHPSIQKGKMWIFFSILEKSFSDSINEIYNKGIDKIYGEKSMLNKNIFEIKKLIEELQKINFHNIMSKEYENYLDFNKTNKSNISNVENIDLEEELKIDFISPILQKRTLIKEKKNTRVFFTYCYTKSSNDYEFIALKENDCKEFTENLNNIIVEQPINEEDGEKNYNIKKVGEFPKKITDNFYTFNHNKNLIIIEDKKNEEEKNDEESNISNINSFSEDYHSLEIIQLKNINEEKNKNEKLKSELVLNPKIPKHLPTDNFYEIKEKTNSEYNKNDILIYRKKRRPISNCLLFYLNKYYKKAPYHKFFKHNLKNRPITLKDQNYQCEICLRKIPILFCIPKEPVYWCSYYMRYICKNCINSEMSIIPHFVLKKWCFEKFTISKKAKRTIEKWYNKPVLVFDKNDKIFNRNPNLNRIINIKKLIINIFDMMKCKNKFQFVEEAMGEYNYLALKENIFSLKDLVEINNLTFLNKINELKNKFIRHISGQCKDCIYEGEICDKCHCGPKIFFYNSDKVFFCKKCRKSFHKKCIGFIGHFH